MNGPTTHKNTVKECLRIAVCEDSSASAEYITELTRRWAKETCHAVQLERYASAENFLFASEDEALFDILLLDVEMGRMNGVELARYLRENGCVAVIVFLTGYPDYMAQGYDVEALHYLLKPIDPGKFREVLDRAAAKCAAREPTLPLKTDAGIIRLPLGTIQSIEALDHYLLIRAKNGEYRVKRSLSSLMGELDGRFLRCHRSYVVNMSRAERVTADAIVLDSGQTVPVARGMTDEAIRAFIRWN